MKTKEKHRAKNICQRQTPDSFFFSPCCVLESIVSLSLVFGLQENEVVLGLEAEILGEETGELELDHELVV